MDRVQGLMLNAEAPTLQCGPSSSAGSYTLTLRDIATGEEQQSPTFLKAPMGRLQNFFPTIKDADVVCAPSINTISSLHELASQVVVVTHGQSDPDFDTVTATLYSPHIPTTKASHNAMTQYEVQHHTALFHMAQGDEWKGSEVEQRSDSKRYRLQTTWVSVKREKYAGDETIPSLLGSLPFLCPTSGVRYSVHALTKQIYWVHVRGLCGWQAFLQVNCSCPNHRALLQAVPSSCDSAEPLQHWPMLRLVPPRAVRVRLANSMRKANLLASDDGKIGLGEMQSELIQLHKEATQLELIAIGDKMLQTLLEGGDVHPAQLLRHLIMMFGGFFASFGSEEIKAMEKVDVPPPTEAAMRQQQKRFWKLCQQTEPRHWYKHLTYPSRESLFKHLSICPDICSMALLPVPLADVLDAADSDVLALPPKSFQGVAYAALKGP